MGESLETGLETVRTMLHEGEEYDRLFDYRKEGNFLARVFFIFIGSGIFLFYLVGIKVVDQAVAIYAGLAIFTLVAIVVALKMNLILQLQSLHKKNTIRASEKLKQLVSEIK